MAQRVTGDEYFEIDGQLSEIKRQLRQHSGYPFDLNALRHHLQDGIEGRFVKTSSLSLLQFLGTVAVPAVKKFSVRRNFVVDTSDDAPVKISDIGYNLQKWFGDKIETKVPTETFRYAKLLKASRNDSILNEIGKAHEETKLAHVFALMLLQQNGEDGVLLTNGYANIFYAHDTAGMLRAVGVYWGGGGWHVYALSVSGPLEWRDGGRVFSRNSSDTVTV